MSIELSSEQLAALQQTRPVDTPAEFETLLQAARPEMARVVRDIQGPNQPIPTTLVELRDLYLTITQHTTALDGVSYDAGRRTLFRDSIRLVDTANLWFSEGARGGAYKVRTVEEVVLTSRPWRARLKAYADQAFVFEPETAEVFADVNSSGTMSEEVSDLRALTQHLRAHQPALAAVGLTEAFAQEGEGLLREAEARDLLGILGLRNQEEAIMLRNSILTYATQLGREARAAGINACFDQPEARRRFEAASFRTALRRLRPRRPGAAARDEEAPAEAPEEQPAATPA
jgi:hypothetical protein